MVKLKAKKDCRFGHLGTMYVFMIGEEQEVDMPMERVDTNSFEILDGSKLKKEKKVKKEEVIEDLEVEENGR